MSQQTLHRHARSRAASLLAGGSRTRLDIQGLRALSVLVVIADHLFKWPSGGFIGVDVFFVISGFLITGLLLREHDRTGRISLVDFYRRRVRRIMPTAVIVLAVTFGAAWLLFPVSRTISVAEDGLWALFFAGNWRFAATGTDYMNADGPVSPLQHFWSLAVEEQFYLLWPGLIILCLGVAVAKGGLSLKVARRSLGICMILMTVASFAFSMWQTSAAPTVAYFSTFTRAWELAVGALLALGASVLATIPSVLRPVLGSVGLAGIVVSVFAINPDTPFPGPWAAVPVLSSALVIAAGTGGEPKFLAPLTNRVSVYLGDISYSLYLWHFPVIVLLSSVMPFEGALHSLAILGVILAIAVLSYHGVEDPVRRSSWLEPGKRGQGGGGNNSPGNNSPEGRKLACIGALAVIAVVAAASAVERTAPLDASSFPAPPLTSSSAPGAAEELSPAAIQSQAVTAALAATVWPRDLEPSLDEVGSDSKAAEWVSDGCLSGHSGAGATDWAENSQRCQYGDASAGNTAVVFGDSIAISYVPGIRAALEEEGYKVHVFTMQQCPSVMVPVLKQDKTAHPDCDEYRQWAMDRISELQPEVVFLSSSQESSWRLASGATADAAVSEWREGVKKTYAGLAGAAARIVALDPPPIAKNPQECAVALSVPLDCVSQPDARYADLSKVLEEESGQAGGSVAHVRTVEWFCNNKSCPAFVGSTIVSADGGHLTNAFSKSLAPLIARTIESESR